MIISRSNSNSDPASCRVLFLVVNFFGVFCLSTYAACYYPNGTNRNPELDFEFYQPCNSSNEHSMCCRSDSNQCRSDGLCLDLTAPQVWRESCTDPTWNSSSCVKLCYSGLGILHQSQAVAKMKLCWCTMKSLPSKGSRATWPILTT